MDPYLAAHLRELEDLHRQVFEMVAPLDDDAINRPVPGLTNTVGIVLRHMAGSERYWIGEVVGGLAAHRHRDAEFGHERLRKTALMQELGGVDTLSREVLGRLTRDELLREVEVHRGKDVVKETKAYALVHATQHLAYHVGQLRILTRLVKGGA